MLPLFAACGGTTDGIVTLSSGTEEVDLSGYAVVYGDSQGCEAYTPTFRGMITAFAGALGAVAGEKISAQPMDKARSGADDKEILVGLTERDESKAALAKIKGDGFIIRVTDNKIVLVGTSNLFTLMAVNYFTDRFLQNGAGTLTLNSEMKADNVGTLTLAEGKTASYTYVHADGMGIYPPAFAGTTSSLSTVTYQEYPQAAIDQITAQMKSLTGVQKKNLPIKTDAESYENQVLVGPVENEASKNALTDVKENEFVISTTDKDVILNAWNEKALAVAVTQYIDLLQEATVKREDGSKAVVFPQSFYYTAVADEEWVLDFPRPDDLTLYNAMDAGDKQLQFLYLGEGVGPEAHRTYCEKLKNEGYRVYMENEIEDSLFTTLVNKETKTMLYVAYNAYSHVEEYKGAYDGVASKVNTGDPNVYEYEPALRVVSAPLQYAYLPDESLIEAQSYTKVADSLITTQPLYNKAVGLTYVITLEDGRLVVFDGGNINENGTEYDRLWKTLVGAHTQMYGTAPTQQNPVHIAAWVLTHAHGDHYYVFERMTKKYGSSGLLKMDYMIANIPAENSAYPVAGVAAAMTPEKVGQLQRNVKGGFELIKVHTGQKFYLANIEIEVLATWEDHNPWVINDGNETNTVLRFTLSNADAPGQKVTQLWTGDAQRWLSRYLCASYGEYLQSDMMSVGHHGNVGCEIDLYDTVKPTTIWWSHNASAAASYLKPQNKSKGFQYEVDQYFANKIDSVHYIFMSGERTDGENYFTTLRFTKNGPDYENIYDLITGQKLSYTDISGEAYEGVSSCMKK